jgi:ribosomal protein L20A (L18A)
MKGVEVPQNQPVELFETILFCETCLQKEKAAQIEVERTAGERLAQLEKNRQPAPDTSISITQDLFNSKIASINEWKKEIEADSTIENKYFALAERMGARYELLYSIITKAQQAVKDAQGEQRVIQSYYNDLSKKLRADEREKIKIADVRYVPPEKPISKPKAPTVKKYDKVAIREAAQLSNFPEQVIQMICVARQVTPVEAVRILRESGLK